MTGKKCIINRDYYLNKLINRRDNGEVKIITGPRRSGKSWLLSKIYRNWLIENGVAEENIISVSLDMDDNDSYDDLTDPKQLKQFLKERISDENQNYYVFLDEIQEVEGFEKIVNALNSHDNIDVYITGSNSRFLSSDIRTIFRGRGDEVRIWPLSFSEFCSIRTEPLRDLWKEYYTYGGMPALLDKHTPEEKTAYLQRLWNKTYLDDVVERNHIKNRQALEALVDTLCSGVGSLTNPSKLANTIHSVQKVKVSDETINSYITCLEDAFLFQGAMRYDIKGRKYFESIKKYYVADVGLRNARLNYRQQEVTHLMENIIYIELCIRGYSVDVGVVEKREMKNGKSELIRYEIDFIASNGVNKLYLQSAYALPDNEKREQELKPLKKIDDSFRKFIIIGDDIASYTDENGFTYIGIMDFLLHKTLLN